MAASLSNMECVMVDTTAAATSCWTELADFLNRWFHEPDLEAVRVVMAACRAHYTDDEPVWLFVIGPSSSGKTSIACNCAAALPQAHMEGDLNMRAMMSCTKGGEQTSVLEQYGKSFILVFKDFTSIISKRDEDQRELIGLFREMYDGAYERKTGARWGSWRGKATVIAAATPAIERAWAAYRMLGERFLQVRWPNGSPRLIARKARAQRGLTHNISKEMRTLALNLFKVNPSGTPPRLSDTHGDRIDSLASMVALLRSHVTRDSHGDRPVIEVSAPEEPARLAHALETLSSNHAVLFGRSQVTEDDLRVARRVAFDSIPSNRAKIIQSIPADACIPVTDIRSLTGMIRSSIEWTADELEAMNVIEIRGALADQRSYTFTESFRELWMASSTSPE